MNYYDFHEKKQHGTDDFPVAFYHIEPWDPRYEMPYHWHRQIEIIRVLHGVFHLIVNGEAHDLHEGEIIYIQDGVSHGGTPEDCVYECVVFDLKLIQKSEFRLGDFLHRLARHKIFIPADALNYSPYTDILFDSLRRRYAGYEMETIGVLLLIHADIYRRMAYDFATDDVNASYAHSAKFIKILDYIEEHYKEQITLEDMGRISELTPHYLCRYFKEMSGMTPNKYLNYYRVERACEQLATQSISVTDAALENGFNDISYFIKSFHKQKGVTPRQYKNARRNTIGLFKKF